ncbi:condensation domain-containing protein [Nostoc sp. XA010]|uniref:phthiocerol/phthiodiolone dimycocerosyl transferase family protein n=1 Tax=Nostoc sp. XA010 TaxID=2780407 RepID=UPI001E63A9FB|nr:condensation domain-containing protein [Nostoc sp. XA010]MCC5661743.1 condensation domain-containing protein [Nostoc sp. XA010]
MNRLLGASEHFLWLRDQAWSVNFALAASVTGTLTVRQLTDALAWVQLRHPLLRVKIAIDEHQQPQFISEDVPAISLRVVQRQGEEHWTQEVADEIVSPFSWSQGPLLRVVLLQGDNSELILICHHSIGDALSIVYLLRDILQEIGTPGSDCQILPEIPPLEELIPPSFQHKNDTVVIANSHHLEPEETPRKWRPTILSWSLEVEETSKLVLRCREEQVTVHGALCASFLLSMIHEAGLSAETSIKCLSPLNARSYLVPPVGLDMGVYIALPVTAHKLKRESDFWDLAREVKHQINEVVAQGKMFEGIPKLKAFLSTKPTPNVVYQQVLERGDDLAVSNLGRLDIPQQFGNLRLRAIYGPTLLGSENVKVVSVATLGGKMFFTFACLESVTSQTDAKQIQARVTQLIHKVVNQSISQGALV